MIRRIASATLAAVLALAAPAVASAQTLYFSAIPDQDESRLEERFGKVADYLEDTLGVEVRYVPVKSYAAAVTAFRNNQVQLAWFGGLSGVMARQAVPDAQAIAQGVEDQRFRTYFIANTESGVQPSDDGLPESLRGKTFTFGSKSSTSGRLMPQHYIQQHFGAAPEEVFERVGFSGNHSKTIDLVASGAYEAGALNFKVWQNAVENGEVDTDKVRVVWKTPAYADYNWTIRGDVTERFGDGFVKRVQQALLDMENPDLLQRFPREAFIPTSAENYEAIRKTARELGLIGG